jgi:hypothetical protein
VAETVPSTLTAKKKIPKSAPRVQWQMVISFGEKKLGRTEKNRLITKTGD